LCPLDAIFDGQEYRIARLHNPGLDNFGGLVAQSSREDRRVIPVMGGAQLRYRPPQYLAGSGSIFTAGISDLHPNIILFSTTDGKLVRVTPLIAAPSDGEKQSDIDECDRDDYPSSALAPPFLDLKDRRTLPHGLALRGSLPLLYSGRGLG